MEFQYDENKSALNLEKHKLDFEQAKALWDDPEHIEFRLSYKQEPRYAVVGKIGGRHWTAIITYRDRETRIISCRRAHKDEERLYDENL